MSDHEQLVLVGTGRVAGYQSCNAILAGLEALRCLLLLLRSQRLLKEEAI